MSSGYGVMFTVLDDFRDQYGIEAQWLGMIVGVGFFSSFVAQIFLAPVADRGHARQLVLLGLVLNVVGLLAMAVGTSLLPLLFGRFVSGIGIGMAFPAIRRIVINGDPDNLGTNVGLLLSADVAGFAAGPALSALMVPSLGIPAPFLSIAGARRAHGPDRAAGEDRRSRPRDGPTDAVRVRPVAQPTDGGGAHDGRRAVPHDRHVRCAVGDRARRPRCRRTDLQCRHHGVRAPADLPRRVRRTLAQRVGPFRLGPLGLLLGAVFMFLYGQLPTGIAMLSVGVVHAVCDGLTVSSTGVAVAVGAPPARQAGAQGMLGAAETLSGGITAVLAGVLYSWGGRSLAYTTCTVIMVALAIGAYVVAGPEYRARSAPEQPVELDPATAVTGHA